MADDDIEDIDFDDGEDVADDIDFDDTPLPQQKPNNARRELERRLEMKRLKELLGDSELDGEI